MSFQAGYIYPLLDPERYDDEDLGTGYDHVAIEHDAQPNGCYVHDAWIVNSKGDVHPGYGECPVPMRPEDVDLARGRRLERSLPTARSVFDGPFFR